MRDATLSSLVARRTASPISLPIGLPVTLACTLLLAGCFGGSPDARSAATETVRDPGYSATDAEIIQTGADGAPRYRLRAARIEQDPRTLEVELQQIRLETRDVDAARWQVDAPKGTLSSNAERLRLEGGVRLEGGDVRDADRVRLATAALDYDLQGARVRAAGAVRITLHGHVLEGTGLDANLRTRQVRLNAHVHGRFAP
jgi:lipopolysaccharide export system protein LptC